MVLQYAGESYITIQELTKVNLSCVHVDLKIKLTNCLSIDRSDCLKLLGECAEKEKLGVRTVKEICDGLSPNDQSSCISMESYLSKVHLLNLYPPFVLRFLGDAFPTELNNLILSCTVLNITLLPSKVMSYFFYLEPSSYQNETTEGKLKFSRYCSL